MAEIIEVLFEEVEQTALIELFTQFDIFSNVKNYNFSNISLPDGLSEIPSLDILKLVLDSYDGLLNIMLKSLNLFGVNSLRVGVQIYKYSGNVDLLFSFEDSIRKQYSADFFLDWVQRIDKVIQSGNFICGLEPTYDESLWFFTKGTDGPLKFNL